MSSGLPPGPRYPSLIQGIGIWKRPLAFLERCRSRYGRRFTIRFPLAPPFVILSDPDEVKEVFAAAPDVLHPGEGARVLEPLVGKNSVILLDEAAHMEQRKLMLPAFHGEKMARLSGLMGEVAEREVASWPQRDAVQLQPRMQHLTLEIILRAVFGLDPGELLDALRERLSTLLTFGDRPISMIGAGIDREGRLGRALEQTPSFARFVRQQEEADAMLFELIDERRSEDVQRDDVLAMLLEARREDGSPMSPQELRDELLTMLVAGHETTASSLAWAFDRLTHTPAVMDRLAAEVESNGDAYLTATIQETLRRRPVLPNVEPRFVKRPIEVGGWRYPTGVCLVPNAYLIHHDPEIYPDPYEFRPERFLEESPGTYTWIPFGGGRRRCIGASFAMLEMQIVLRTVLTARQLSPAATGFELAKRRNITIRPAEGARAVLRERTREPVPT
jgi:cytochrome P450